MRRKRAHRRMTNTGDVAPVGKQSRDVGLEIRVDVRVEVVEGAVISW